MATPSYLDLLSDVIAKTQRAGADACDALVIVDETISASVRLGQKEDISRSEGSDLGLRVFINGSQAIAATSDFSAKGVDELIERAVNMAKVTPKDPFARLADAERLYQAGPDLDLLDPQNISPDRLMETAMAVEDAARAVTGITNSEGGQASWSQRKIALATSHGFLAERAGSSGSIAVSVIAGAGTGMERDYDYSTARHWEDLDTPQNIGKSAGDRTVRRLNPTKIKTGAMPVVFDPRVAGSLVGHFASAANGQAIARGASFLRGKMGQAIFAPGIDIIDDPLRLRGLRSRHFDAEGVASQVVKLAEDGQLASWLLDSATAAQLELETTGHAARSPAGPPSPRPTNLYMSAGAASAKDLIADIELGFYATDLIGMGVNGVTGDFSQGANGFLIEKGEITRPVSEITIAGNLLDMFKTATPANDLVFRYGVNAPTLRIERMTIAGA